MIGIIDYNIENLRITLKNLKNNPMELKIKDMYLIVREKGGIDVNYITESLCLRIPVGIEKTHNNSSKFSLLYEYTKLRDLCIVIDIIDEEEIEVITVIEKSTSRRKH